MPVLMEAQKLVDAMQRREKRRKLIAKILAIVLLIISGLAVIGGVVLIAIGPKMDRADLDLIGLIILFLGIWGIISTWVIFFLSDSIQLSSMKAYQMEALPTPSLSASKVYQMEVLPVGIRCMVSHLEIHMEMDEIVACPYCEGFAKKELLKEWLEEKSLCPACRRRLQIEECLIVQLKEADGEKG